MYTLCTETLVYTNTYVHTHLSAIVEYRCTVFKHGLQAVGCGRGLECHTVSGVGGVSLEVGGDPMS